MFTSRASVFSKDVWDQSLKLLSLFYVVKLTKYETAVKFTMVVAELVSDETRTWI